MASNPHFLTMIDIQEFQPLAAKSTSKAVSDDEDEMVLNYSDSDEDDRSSKQSKNENFKDALDFLDTDNQLEAILSDDEGVKKEATVTSSNTEEVSDETTITASSAEEVETSITEEEPIEAAELVTGSALIIKEVASIIKVEMEADVEPYVLEIDDVHAVVETKPTREELSDAMDTTNDFNKADEHEITFVEIKIEADEVTESDVTESPTRSENLTEEPMVIEPEEMSTSDVESKLRKRKSQFDVICEPEAKRKRDDEDLSNTENVLNTQAISNNLGEETTAQRTSEVSSVVTQKDPEPTNEQELSIQQEVTNQETSEPITQETPTIEKASDENIEPEKILTLDPPPKKTLCPTAFSLNFVRKFRKNFNKMNRNDLEELLIQKCVEAIVHKSDYADMRNRIEAQENKLQFYRTKFQELSKEYRDLEMVHQRVVKDLEAKNESVVMPVKITRAVGLQVCLPRKEIAVPKPIAALPTAPPTTAQTNAAINRNRRKVPPQRPNDPNPHQQQQQQQQQQQLIRQNMLTRRSEISIQQQRSQFQQQQQTQKKLLKQQLMRSNSPAFKPQANVRKPAAPQFSPLSLNQINQNSSRKRPGLAERPRIPPVVLKKMGTQGRMISVTSSSSNSITANVYSNQSKLANTTIVRSSVTATAITTTIDLTEDSTDEEDSNRLNVVSNGTNPPPLVAIPTKATAAQGKVKQNSPHSTIQIVPLRLTQKIGNNYVSIAPKNNAVTQQPTTTLTAIQRHQHPAPLPLSYQPSNSLWKYIPPRPIIRINKVESGIVISWTMDEMTDKHAKVVTYQIYAYQETSAAPSPETWRHVGDVKAMLLPMAATLREFQEGQRYHFAVRAVDEYSRFGIFSLPKTWM